MPNDNKEKLKKLRDHKSRIESKLSETVLPEKHKNRQPTYKRFLRLELQAVENNIKALELA